MPAIESNQDDFTEATDRWRARAARDGATAYYEALIERFDYLAPWLVKSVPSDSLPPLPMPSELVELVFQTVLQEIEARQENVQELHRYATQTRLVERRAEQLRQAGDALREVFDANPASYPDTASWMGCKAARAWDNARGPGPRTTTPTWVRHLRPCPLCGGLSVEVTPGPPMTGVESLSCPDCRLRVGPWRRDVVEAVWNRRVTVDECARRTKAPLPGGHRD